MTTSTLKSPSPHSLYNRPLTISDILSLPDGDDAFMDASIPHSSCATLHCTSPYRIVSRLFSAFKWTNPFKIQRRREADDRTLQAHPSLPQNGFNIGVGCGLLYVVAASKKELDKMAELTTQMETLFQTTKQELQNKHTLSHPTPTQLQTSPQTLTALSYHLHDSSTLTFSDESLKCEGFKGEEERVDGLDRLKAELESELERLQAQLDGEKKLLNHSWRRPSIREGIEETASKSYEASSGEVIDPVIDPEFECMDVQCAVSPYELERRLHELLESRQQEQIQELEAGLEYLKRKLLEKEFEVSWWKDTARLISRHAAESSRITSHRDRNSCISR